MAELPKSISVSVFDIEKYAAILREQEQHIAELESALLREKRRIDSLHECIDQRDSEIARLRDSLSEIREAYAGSEGIPVAETAAEAYVLRLVQQMYRISVEALDTKGVGDG